MKPTISQFRIYDKCKSVISSCQKKEHLDIAKRFMDAGIRILPRTDFGVEAELTLKNSYYNKVHEIDPDRHSGGLQSILDTGSYYAPQSQYAPNPNYAQLATLGGVLGCAFGRSL